MIPLDAAKILDLPADASPDQLEARFQELRAKLENKIAKAPTPGLKAKYRESLDDITTAFETLTLAADSSSLPVLNREKGTIGDAPSPRELSPAAPNPKSRIENRKSGKEFLFVALLAVVVLGAGGWWMMQTLAENETKVRLAAEAEAKAKAESERKAEEKLQAEAAQKKLAAEAAEAAKAEEQRMEQLRLQVRTRLSELNIALDAILRSEAAAERELTELKTEERSLARDARGAATPDLRAAQAQTQAHDRYFTWLRDHLAASPARATRARLEELVSAKAWTEATTNLEPYAATIKQLQGDLAAKRAELLNLSGSLSVTAEPAEVDFILQDTYGRSRPGRTPAELTDVPLGRTTLTFRRDGWPEQTKTVTVARGPAATVSGDLIGGAVEIATSPAGVGFILQGQNRKESGRTPAKFAELPLGDYTLTFQRAGWPEQQQTVSVKRALTATAQVSYPAAGTVKVTSIPEGAEVWRGDRQLGITPLTLTEVVPGNIEIELRLKGYLPSRTGGEVKSSAQLELSSNLVKIVLTQQEVYEEFWRQAAGVWQAGNSPNFWRVTAGSTTIIRRLKFLGTDDSKITMDSVEPGTNKIKTSAFLEPTRWVWFQDGQLFYGNLDQKKGLTRVPDSAW
jgi:hypothetical protein